jgi:hypothetical protein
MEVAFSCYLLLFELFFRALRIISKKIQKNTSFLSSEKSGEIGEDKELKFQPFDTERNVFQKKVFFWHGIMTPTRFGQLKELS